MPTSNFPGGATPQYQWYSWSGNPPVRTNSFNLPSANLAANGKRPLIVTDLRGYMCGYGASRTVSMQIGTTATSNFTAAAGSKAVDTGFKSLSAFFADYGSTIIYFNSSGNLMFGRAETAGTTYDASNNTWGGALCGQFKWIESPTKPAAPTVVWDSQESKVFVTAKVPSDTGGTSLTGHRIQYWESTTPGSVTTLNISGTTTEIAGLTAGKTYVFKTAAKNSVTDAAGTTSEYSSTSSVVIGTGTGGPTGILSIEVWNGTSWVA